MHSETVKNNSVYRKVVGIPLHTFAKDSPDNGLTGRNMLRIFAKTRNVSITKLVVIEWITME
jgi:hypothetical protein